MRQSDWVVYAKEPFGGPEAVLAYLARYTHRVAISNRRLIRLENNAVTFKYKDYRINGPARYKTMTLPLAEFIRRFLMHVLPRRFHRIRHCGLSANGNRAAYVARARELLGVATAIDDHDDDQQAENGEPTVPDHPCPCCGGNMIVIEVFEPGCKPKHGPTPEAIDSS